MEEINDALSQLGQLKDGEWDLSHYGLTCKVWYEDMISFRYVNAPEGMVKEEGGCMYGRELLRLCDRLKNGGTIYKKPASIRLLEQVMNVKAFLCATIDQWHIEKKGVKLHNEEDLFEIAFDDDEPVRSLTLQRLLQILFDNEYIVNRCRHCERYDRLMMRCKGSCFYTLYCNAECQRQDWAKHRVHCQSK